jgi:hypothetical protein
LLDWLRVECEDASESTVVGRHVSQDYKVHLSRLAPSRSGHLGIWTTTRVEVW